MVNGYKTLIYDISGSVATITINRPAAGNAINAQLAHELADVCSNIQSNESIHVAVLTGAGGEAFCSGIDRTEFPLEPGGEKPALPLVVSAVADLDCPVIAAVNGDALGQGLELALTCDIRVAVETARFALPINSGHIPWDGGTQRLPRLVGKGKAMEMILAGEVIDPAEAYRIGLVNRVVPSAELISTVSDIAQAMASKAPWALRYGKEAVNKGLELTLEQGLRLEADLYSLLQTTEDRVEGIKAFLEKRSPNFTGK